MTLLEFAEKLEAKWRQEPGSVPDVSGILDDFVPWYDNNEDVIATMLINNRMDINYKDFRPKMIGYMFKEPGNDLRDNDSRNPVPNP